MATGQDTQPTIRIIHAQARAIPLLAVSVCGLIVALSIFALAAAFTALRFHNSAAAAIRSQPPQDEHWVQQGYLWRAEGGSWSQTAGQFIADDTGILVLTETLPLGFAVEVTLETVSTELLRGNVARVLFNYHSDDHTYAVYLRSDGRLQLTRLDPHMGRITLAKEETGLDPRQPHQILIERFGGQIRVWIDGNMTLEALEASPLDGGHLALWSGTGGAAFGIRRIDLESSCCPSLQADH